MHDKLVKFGAAMQTIGNKLKLNTCPYESKVVDDAITVKVFDCNFTVMWNEDNNRYMLSTEVWVHGSRDEPGFYDICELDETISMDELIRNIFSLAITQHIDNQLESLGIAEMIEEQKEYF